MTASMITTIVPVGFEFDAFMGTINPTDVSSPQERASTQQELSWKNPNFIWPSVYIYIYIYALHTVPFELGSYDHSWLAIVPETMEKTIEDNGTTWEKPWKNPWKNHGKTVEKPIEKPMEKPMEIPRWFMWPHLLLLELYILVSHLLGGMVGWWSPPAPPRAFSKVIPSSVMKNSLYRPWFPLGYIYIYYVLFIYLYTLYIHIIYIYMEP